MPFSSTRVLLNGVQEEIIYNRRGFRQGDPLSPPLFVIVMDGLHHLLRHATVAGVLTPLAPSGLRQRTSIYADGVVTFIRPDLRSLKACSLLIEDFGVASGLRTNIAKCFAHPICCSDEQLQLIAAELGCQVMGWPCRYLGLPLGLRKISAAQLQYLIDRMADRLPAWQVRLLFRAGRLELVRTTLASMHVHVMIALDIPIKKLEAANKICRGFLWKGRRDVQGGHCLMAWDQVCTPKEYGGLGVPNLRMLNTALRARWPWVARTEQDRPWSEFNIQVSPESMGIYKAATKCALGSGEVARFWTNWWPWDGRIEDTMPNLYAVVRKQAWKKTVRHAMTEGWWQDVSPNMEAQALREFMQLVDRTQQVQLLDGVEDRLSWSWESSGCFSASSACGAFFAGRVEAQVAKQIWRSRAPATCRFFTWLAARERCWMGDRLERTHCHTQRPAPCDQAPETINHILLGCVLARQVWYPIISNWNKPRVDADRRSQSRDMVD